jgi:xylulokinase
MRSIGVYIGASFIKGGILDLEEGRVQNIERVPFPAFVSNLPPAYREVELSAIEGAFRSILERLLREAPDAQSILTCHQMHGCILVDADGNPLTHFISWQDTRAASHLDVLRRLLSAHEIEELGNEVGVGRPLTLLSWFQTHGKLPKGAAPLPLGSFLLTRTAGAPPTTDATNASAHGALHLARGEWHWNVLAKLQLLHLRWPKIAPHTEVVGQFRWEGRAIPCLNPIGDQQCSLLGTFLEDDELSINIGTGSQVSVLTHDPNPCGVQIRPHPPGTYLRTITHIPAGRALMFLLQLLHRTDEDKDSLWRTLDTAARAIPQTELRINLGFFPVAVHGPGGIWNLREDTRNLGHFTRAAFASMAENYQRCAARLETTKPWKRIAFSGGLAHRCPLLRELIEEHIGLSGRLSHSPEETLIGLLALARTATQKSTLVPQCETLAGQR